MDVKTIAVNAQVIFTMNKYFTVPKEDEREYFKGVTVYRVDDKHVRFCATDGKVLAMLTVAADIDRFDPIRLSTEAIKKLKIQMGRYGRDKHILLMLDDVGYSAGYGDVTLNEHEKIEVIPPLKLESVVPAQAVPISFGRAHSAHFGDNFVSCGVLFEVTNASADFGKGFGFYTSTKPDSKMLIAHSNSSENVMTVLIMGREADYREEYEHIMQEGMEEALKAREERLAKYTS